MHSRLLNHLGVLLHSSCREQAAFVQFGRAVELDLSNENALINHAELGQKLVISWKFVCRTVSDRVSKQGRFDLAVRDYVALVLLHSADKAELADLKAIVQVSKCHLTVIK